MSGSAPTKEAEHDADQAIGFLRAFRPEGQWILTRIGPDNGLIESRVLAAGDDDGVRAFARSSSGWNLYFMVNPARPFKGAKADKTEVARVDYLHVDVDPTDVTDPDLTIADKRKHVEKDRTRILDKLRAPAGVPAPTFLIDSGGGYQGLWKLAEPLELGGETQSARDSAIARGDAYNRGLELALGGDHCFNIDRILRLPGSINYPNLKKRARGRTIRRAGLVGSAPARVYDLGAFRAVDAPLASTPASSSRSRAAVRAAVAESGAVRRWTIDELRATDWGARVPADVYVTIVQGFNPDDRKEVGAGAPRGHRRSEWLFWVCCALARAKAPDAVVYSVITDPDFKISASVLDKPGRERERYAYRQIDRARDHAFHPMLCEMNERHAVISSYGGKCVVIEEVDDEILDRSRLVVQAFGHFRNRYDHRRVTVGKTKRGEDEQMPLGQWWLAQENRKQFERIVFAPEREIAGAYNLWQGFAYEPRPGRAHEPYLAMVRDVICRGDETAYAYLLGWMATLVQKPAQPGHVAVVLRGHRGVGKGTFAHVLGRLLGRHYVQVVNANHLVGNFNAHLRDALLVFADEAFYAGDKQHEAQLKALITEPTLRVEAKGVDSEETPNFVHLIMASNSDWVAPVGPFERRFLVLDVGDQYRQNEAYFKGIVDGMAADDGAGYASLLDHLRAMDLSEFSVRTVPRTTGLRDQYVQSLDTLGEWWLGKLEDGSLLPDHVEWGMPVVKDYLLADYYAYAGRLGGRRATSHSIGKFLARACPGIVSYQKRCRRYDEGRREWIVARPMFWEFPPLEACRAAFGAMGLGDHPWSDPTERPADPVAPDPF